MCGLAVKICGGQDAFRKQANVLKRLVKQYGAKDVEIMLKGAQVLGWRDLVSLGSKEGTGRRWATTAYWHRQKQAPPATLESLGALFKARGLL